MIKTKDKIQELERIATEASHALKEARADLKTEKKQEDISLVKQALTTLVQTGVEVSQDSMDYLDCYIDGLGNRENRYERTIVTYLPEQEALRIISGRREIKTYFTREKTTWDSVYREKCTILAKHYGKVRIAIGSNKLECLATDAKTTLEGLARFNSGDYDTLTEAVARNIIRNRINEGMQRRIKASNLQYSPPGEEKVSGALNSMRSSLSHPLDQIPIIYEIPGITKIYFCKDLDVFVDYNRFTPGIGEEANFYGKEKNTGKLIKLIKDRDKYEVKGGSGW